MWLRQLGLQGLGIHQGTLMSLSRCSLTSEQVRKHYMSGGPEAHESTRIIFVEAEVRSGKILLE